MDITSYLISNGITDLSSAVAATSNSKTTSDRDNTSNISEEFSALLSDEVAKLSEETSENAQIAEMENLIASLDKSILGSVMSKLDKDDLAQELANNPEQAKDVLSMLTSGHMQAIVTTDSGTESEDIEDSLTSSTTESLSGTSDSTDSTESLAENLETIIASIGQNITNN